jgi:dihydrodipicolinate synthase/N-acetylneuraminate lyase
VSIEIRRALLEDPLRNMPAWTVALLDPTTGDLPRRKIDEPATRHYVEAIAHAGAPGVLWASSTGWGHKRTLSEIMQWLEIGSRVQLGKTNSQALLRIEDSLDENRTLLQALQNWNYAMVWTRRGSTLAADAGDEAVADAMLPLIELAIKHDMPIGLYSISTVDGAPLTVEAARLILQKLGKKHAQYVVAVKITEADFENSTMAYLREPAFRHKKIVQGWDEHYGRAMQVGHMADGSYHCGATSGAAACMVKAYRAMYQRALQHDWAGLARIQKAVTAAFLSMQGEDKSIFPDLQIAKMVMGLGQPLTEERAMADGDRLVTTVEQLALQADTHEGAQLIAASLLLMDRTEPGISPFYERLHRLEIL